MTPSRLPSASPTVHHTPTPLTAPSPDETHALCLQAARAPLPAGCADLTLCIRELGGVVPDHQAVIATPQAAQAVTALSHAVDQRGLAGMQAVFCGPPGPALDGLQLLWARTLVPDQNAENGPRRSWMEALARMPAEQWTERIPTLHAAGFDLHAGLASALRHPNIPALLPLLQAGANSYQIDAQGHSPLDVLAQSALAEYQSQPSSAALGVLVQRCLDLREHLDPALITQARVLSSALATTPAFQERLLQAVHTAADQGHAWAQLALAKLRPHNGDTQLKKAARGLIRQAAEQGLAHAQYFVGMEYELARGNGQNSQQAIVWFERAAAQGHAKAQFALGTFYETGNGFERDSEKAAAWFEQAAAQGYAKAQFHMGALYAHGHGVALDPKRAQTWLQRAALGGHTGAGKILLAYWLDQPDEDAQPVPPALLGNLIQESTDPIVIQARSIHHAKTVFEALTAQLERDPIEPLPTWAPEPVVSFRAMVLRFEQPVASDTLKAQATTYLDRLFEAKHTLTEGEYVTACKTVKALWENGASYQHALDILTDETTYRRLFPEG